MRMATALATVVLTFGLGATAQAGTTTNLIAANKLVLNTIVPNKLAANAIVRNRVVANRLAANGLGVAAGRGAVDDIVSIELPDGTKFVH